VLGYVTADVIAAACRRLVCWRLRRFFLPMLALCLTVGALRKLPSMPLDDQPVAGRSCAAVRGGDQK